MYRGYNITATCVPLFNMMYMPIYETFKKKFVEWYGFEEESFLLYQASATSAGAICNVISNPLWLVRVRMQAEAFRSLNEQNYKSKYPLNIFKTLRIVQS